MAGVVIRNADWIVTVDRERRILPERRHRDRG